MMLKRAVHPGAILKDELAEIGVSPTEFARQIEVPPGRISQIISGKRDISADSALRFGHWFGTPQPISSFIQYSPPLSNAKSRAH